MQKDFSLVASVLMRFLRGGIAGAVSLMVLINVAGGAHSFSDIKTFLASLVVAGIYGFITGALMAADKFFRATPADTTTTSASL